MTVAIHQPNFLPWCGYFAKMRACDVFVFLDDAQMSSQSYTSRVRIRRGDDAAWLSVPCHFSLGDSILETRFSEGPWRRKHAATLEQTYGRAPFFGTVWPRLEERYMQGQSLAEWNMSLIEVLAELLGLRVRMVRSSELAVGGASDSRLSAIVQALGGDTYLSGAGGSNYQDPATFEAAGIKLEVRKYDPVAYDQGARPFVPALSVFDALCHLGPRAAELLTYKAVEQGAACASGS